MVTRAELIEKIIAAANDKEVKRILREDDFDACGSDFFRTHEKSLRAVLPTRYEEAAKVYEEGCCPVYNLPDLLIVYAAMEQKIIDGTVLSSVENIRPLGIDFWWRNDFLDGSMLYAEGLDGGIFTIEDVFLFVDEKPEYVDFFLPLLIGRGNESAWKRISDWIKTAGQTDTLRISVFRQMLRTDNPAALAFFIRQIESNNYYRFKALNEAVAEMGIQCSQSSLTPAKVIPVLKDALEKAFAKYLSRPFSENYYFQAAVKRLYPDEFSAYVQKVLKDGMPEARYALLYVLSDQEVNKKYARDIFSSVFGQEEFSFLLYKLNGKELEKSILPDVFYRILKIYDGMKKVSYHFGITKSIPFARDVSKREVVSFLTEAACALNEKKYFECLDARYEGFGESAQAIYLKKAGNKTALDVRACTVRFLKTDNYETSIFYREQNIQLTYDEAVQVSEFLKTRRQHVKSEIIQAFLASPAREKIKTYLLNAKEDYKVSAGQEMAGLDGKIDPESLKNRSEFSYFGPSPDIFSIPRPEAEIKALLKTPPKAFRKKSIALQRLGGFFDALGRFTEAHKDYEYKSWLTDGLLTFGSSFKELSAHDVKSRRMFADYPLGEELKELIRSSLTEDEIVSLFMLLYCRDEEYRPYYSVAYERTLFLSQSGKLFGFITADDGNRKYLVEIMQTLKLPVLYELFSRETIIQLLELLSRKNFFKKKNPDGRPEPYWVAVLNALFDWAENIGGEDPVDTELLRACAYAVCIQLLHKTNNPLPLTLFAKLYESGIVSGDFLRYALLSGAVCLGDLSNRNSTVYLYREEVPCPRFRHFMLGLIDEGLDAELRRGSIATPYNKIVRGLNYFEGMRFFFRAIVAIRGMTIARSFSYYSSEKNESISKIMKYTAKSEGDTYDDFVRLVKEYGISREELVRASLYNPSFIDYAERYLCIPGFKLAVYYFIAHLNESEPWGYDRLFELRKETIKEYSDIDYSDFVDGAFDYKWYREMVATVPADQLKMIYDNAKYVTVGGLHKRAQRFFDAMSGKIAKEECVERIKASRNKDFCLAYSLIPIESREELRERYVFLQEFLKESKKYGVQRQQGERRTVDIALDNLARAAGYSDTALFIFELEADDPHDIYRTYTVDDIEITPFIEESKYKVACKVFRNGKKLSSVPSKYAKNPTVAWLKEEVKQLNGKFRRLSRCFEQAMCDRAVFSPERIVHMSREKTIEFMLSHLIFFVGGKPAVFREGKFSDLQGRPVEDGDIFIAHPVEMKKAGVLAEAMEYIVRNNVRQPFKQVLREIYLKSEAELSQDSVLRFKGFNVDLKKCVSALKGKGWGISEDIGLRKVYYASDTVAALFRKFDELYMYDFENVNRELHSILFLSRRTEEIRPLKDVEDITFSEALRDVDLMITISANGVYDYELAMSTVEVRREILRSIVSVLGLENISFLKDNISIKGKYGNYLVNIRTGLVFKEGKGNLLLDTVYSTDKALLLDFIDEDPMTADIVSKAVVLARDSVIKDPAVLREIKG